MAMGNQPDSQVDLQEFYEYYNNVSCSIDSDEYFETMMDGSWNLSGHAATYQQYDKGWGSDSKPSQPQVYQYSNADPYANSNYRVDATLRSGLESGDNPWTTTDTYYDRSSPFKGKQISNPKHDTEFRVKAQITGQESSGNVLNQSVIKAYEKHLESKGMNLQYEQGPTHLAQKRDTEIKLSRFKKALFDRGIRGIIGLLRQFKLFDENGNGTLELDEFEKAVMDYKIGAQRADLQHLFQAFDLNGDGHINFDELMTVTVGELPPHRAAMVELAWRRINPTQAGKVPYKVVTKAFQGSRHPAVKVMERTQDDVTLEFQQTFSTHHKVWHEFHDVQTIDKEEFFNYFRVLSATTQIDGEFQAYMTDVWNVDVKLITTGATAGKGHTEEFTSHRAAWKHDMHRKMFGDMDHKSFEHPTGEPGLARSRPKTAVTTSMKPAGVTNWPYASQSVTKSNVECLGGPKTSKIEVGGHDEVLAKFRSTIIS